MDFGNMTNTPPDQQAMINALMQHIEALKRNGNDDVLALITAKLTQEAASTASSFSSILPSPSSSISSPSQASLMSQLPTPIGVYSNHQQIIHPQQQTSITNVATSSSFYHPNANNPLSPPSIIPSPSSAFYIPSGSVGTPSNSSIMSTAAPTPMPGALGQLPQQSDIEKLLQSFSFTNILQNVQNLGSLNFQLPQNSANCLNNPAIPSIPLQQHQQPPKLSQPQTPYLQQQSQQPQLNQNHQQSQQILQQQLYSQPSTSASFISNPSDDESIIDERQQDTPKSSCTSVAGIPRKRKLKQQFDVNGKPIVQRIRRRRRNGSIPEEDSNAVKSLEKITPPGCRKQPPLPDNNEQVCWIWDEIWG
jgi:hypothetical protein